MEGVICVVKISCMCCVCMCCVLDGFGYSVRACVYKDIPHQQVQQRSCEFGRMFVHNDVRSHLVEAIPPLDESTYSSNLTDQAVVDNAAGQTLVNTAEDLLLPTNGATPVAGLTATAAATADLMDLLSLDVPAATGGVGGMGGGTGGAPVVDLLGDLLGNGQGI